MSANTVDNTYMCSIAHNVISAFAIIPKKIFLEYHASFGQTLIRKPDFVCAHPMQNRQENKLHLGH